MDEGSAFSLPVTQNGAWDTQATPRLTPVGTGCATGGRATFVTIATPDRAAQSRIFARSARECHPDARLVVLALESDGAAPLFEDLFDLVISAEQLALGCLADMRFRYSTAELCFALKPWVILHLLEKFPGEAIYYFDSDIELFTPLAEVEAALAQGANLVLTPHILQPAPDQDAEEALLRSGSLNAGFLAVAPTSEGRGFVAWWGERLRTGCTLDATCGDQKWLELVPSICDGVKILRHPGYNFACWNAHERPLSCLDGAWTAAGRPLRFVHYTKWNLRAQDSEQYLARNFRREYREFAGLFADYHKKFREEDRFGSERPPGVYGEVHAPGGKPVPAVVRSAYARHGPTADGHASEVFARAVAILNAPSACRADLPGVPITILCDEIWQRDPGLRYRFDVDQAGGRLAYLRWLVETGVAELAIPDAFVTLARAALDRERVRQLEAGDAATAPPPALADPALPRLPTAADTPDNAAALPDTIAGLIAARDAERDRTRRQDNDIRLLVSSNKALRREGQALRVRFWRVEERVRALENELAQTRRARDSAARRGRLLADEVATLRSRSWYQWAWYQWPWLRARPGANRTGLFRQPVLVGGGAFFERGFLLGEAAEISGTAVRRTARAPSGMLIFGPYVNLSAGTYAVTLDARLYRMLPAWTSFKLDVVCDDARQIVGMRWCRLHSIARRRSFELIFTVSDGEEHPDFEVRVWARNGTSLEIGRLDLHRLTEEPPAESAGAPDANGDAASP